MATQRDRFRAYNDEDGMSLDDLLMQIQQPQIDTEAIARQQIEAQLRAQQEAQARAQIEAQVRAQQEAQRQAQIAAEQRAYEEQTYRQAQARQEELRAQNAARLAAEQEAARQAQLAQERAQAQARAQAEQQARAQAEAQQEAQARAQAEQQRQVFAQQEAQRQAEIQAQRQAEAQQQAERQAQAQRLAEFEAQQQAQIMAEQEAKRQVFNQRQPKQPITAQEVINQIAAQPAPAQPAPVQSVQPTQQAPDKASIINNLVGQIKARSNTSQWSGGYGADEATKDMARILAETGITDISQFGKVDKYEPVEQIGMTLNGQPVQGSGSQLYILETVDTGDGSSYVRRDLSPDEAAQVQPTYGVVTGTDEYNQPTYRAVEATNVAIKDGQLVGVTGQTFGNKLTGQTVPNTYTERQTGDFFGGTYEGKGNTGYGVRFDAQGNPIFYTQGASSKDELIKPLATMALMALGAYGIENLLGAGAAGGAGATGAGLATTGELGTLAGTAGGTGITAGASGLGINAAGAGLGAAGTGAGITAGAGLTGTGVLTGSTLGTGLLGTGLGAAGLTGTGILSGSELGKALLGTTSTTPLIGTGILSGSELGSQLLGTGANTAATVGGVTGLTNAANVGAGALNTGVSTGITGLGSGALNTGINPSGASTIAPPVTTPVVPTPTTGLTPSDAIRAASVIATIAGAGSMANSGSGGFPIVPIPSDWTSPIKPTGSTNVAPTQLSPIDFGNRELLRGTQWEKFLDPNYGQVPAPVQFNQPTNMSYDRLMSILGTGRDVLPSQALTINDVISGIQNQYGQTTNSAMGQKPT